MVINETACFMTKTEYMFTFRISIMYFFIILYCTHPSSAFSIFGIGALSSHPPRSPGLCFFSLYSFLLCIFSYKITPLQFWSSYISLSSHFHFPSYPCYIFFSFYHSTCNHLSLTYLVCSLMCALISSVLIFSILSIPIIRVRVLSQCPGLPSIQYNRYAGGLMYCHLERNWHPLVAYYS